MSLSRAIVSLQCVLTRVRPGSRVVARCLATSAKSNLRKSHSVYTFGKTDYGNFTDEKKVAKTDQKIPVKMQLPSEGLRFARAAAGWMQNFLVTEDGKLYAWGQNDFGQLAMAYRQSRIYASPALAETLAGTKLQNVTTGRCHTLIHTAEGDVLSCGNNEVGQLGLDSMEATSKGHPELISYLRGKNIVQIKAGLDHSLALSASGEVYAWGFNQEGQLGIGDTEPEEPVRHPIAIPNIPEIASIDCGFDHSILVDRNGHLWVCGSNRAGQLALGTKKGEEHKPVQVAVPGVFFTKTVSGGLHSVGLTNKGEVYSWGSGASGRLGHGDDADSLVPKKVEFFHEKKLNVVDVSAGGGHTFALTEKGQLYVWGYGGNGRLGFRDIIDRLIPEKIPFFEKKKVVLCAGGLDHSLVVTEGGAQFFAYGTMKRHNRFPPTNLARGFRWVHQSAFFQPWNLLLRKENTSRKKIQ